MLNGTNRKSVASTPVTGSLKVTVHDTLFTLVGLGSPRTIDCTDWWSRVARVVILDGPVGDALIDRNDRPAWVGQSHRERLIAFDVGVSVHVDGDGFVGLTWSERQRSTGGYVIAVGNGVGSVRGRVVDRDRLRPGREERDRERERARPTAPSACETLSMASTLSGERCRGKCSRHRRCHHWQPRRRERRGQGGRSLHRGTHRCWEWR